MINKNKILILCLVIIVIVSIITNLCILSSKSKDKEISIEGIDTINSKEMLKDTTIEGLKITNISLLTIDGISSYKAIITNVTDEDIYIDKLYVVFMENEKENKVLVLMNTKLQPNVSTNIAITSESDLSKATNIKYLIEEDSSE